MLHALKANKITERVKKSKNRKAVIEYENKLKARVLNSLLNFLETSRAHNNLWRLHLTKALNFRNSKLYYRSLQALKVAAFRKRVQEYFRQKAEFVVKRDYFNKL